MSRFRAEFWLMNVQRLNRFQLPQGFRGRSGW